MIGASAFPRTNGPGYVPPEGTTGSARSGAVDISVGAVGAAAEGGGGAGFEAGGAGAGPDAVGADAGVHAAKAKAKLARARSGR